MAKEIKTEIRIKATPEKVWEVLTGFEKYPNWNPFIKSISGEMIPGKTINVFITPPEKKGMKFRPRVLVFNKHREFRWKGRLLFPGIFDGEHIFELVDVKDGNTLFIQREVFGGILVPFLTKMLDINTANGFKRMNEQLKAEAEKM